MQRFELESFDAPPEPSSTLALEPAELEEMKLVAFEKGYSAGWDDAVASQTNESRQRHADMEQNIQGLAFTFQEARQHVLMSLRPLLVDLCAKVLPHMAQQALPHIVAEHILPRAEELTQTPVTVVVNPAGLEHVRDVLAQQDALPVSFLAEKTLGDGQVFLKFQDAEMHVDLDGMIARIADAVEGYFNSNSKEEADGRG